MLSPLRSLLNSTISRMVLTRTIVFFCNEDIVQERFAFLSTLLISPLALDEYTTALIVITNFHMTW